MPSSGTPQVCHEPCKVIREDDENDSWALSQQLLLLRELITVACHTTIALLLSVRSPSFLVVECHHLNHRSWRLWHHCSPSCFAIVC